LSVINQSGYYWASSTDGHNRQPVLEWRDGMPKIYYSRNFEDANYYYMEFKDGEALGTFQLRKIIKPDLYAQIKNKNSNYYLILNNSHEAFMSVVDPLYRHIVLGHNIPAEKIILMTGSFDIVKEIETVRERYGKPAIKAELTMDFEDAAHSHYAVLTHEGRWNPPKTMHSGPYQKKFLNFNRRWRLHRPTFVMMLKQAGLLDQGFISLAKSDCGSRWDEQLWSTIVSMHQDFPHIVSMAYDMKDELMDMPDLYLDEQDLVTNRADIEMTTAHNKLYEQSYFSLVSETNFYTVHTGYEASRFLSEKAWKPILFKHPFLMISTPGILSALRQIGYKTFEGVIDETYDTIQDDGHRLEAIVRETQRLCAFNDKEREDFIRGCTPILEHNFQVLTRKRVFHHKLNYTL
jgi:hypothetical protein